MYKKFNPLNISSKFAICGLPLRVDTYKTCSFNCAYCFANNRKVMEFSKEEIQIGNLNTVKNKLHKVLGLGSINTTDMIEALIKQGITWHCGGMSDPFQPIEANLHVTKDLIDICNAYNIHILFSTKSDSVYSANINPQLHTFQLSVTNINNNRLIEPNTPNIEERLRFFKDLRSQGFKVGVRIQPCIPNVSTLDIVKYFKGADHFTLEGIKLVPQNKEHKEYLLEVLKLNREDFTQMGLLNLKPEVRLSMYQPFIDYFKDNNISYSIADNDLHYMGNNSCCGDALSNKFTTFNNTCMLHKYGEYTEADVVKELGPLKDCKVNHLFTSNRQEGCVTVEEFYSKRFNRKSSPFSPLFQYKGER